jgi:hypothetical protein
MRAFAVLALSLSALIVTPAVAKDKKPIDPNKKSCRREEVTGTIMGGRLVCHTHAEWVQIDEANAERTQRLMNDRNGQSGVRQ